MSALNGKQNAFAILHSHQAVARDQRNAVQIKVWAGDDYRQLGSSTIHRGSVECFAITQASGITKVDQWQAFSIMIYPVALNKFVLCLASTVNVIMFQQGVHFLANISNRSQ